MTDDAADVLVVRGENPEPDDGWPWYLTDYEIAYIREWNVRPPRSGSWVATKDAEHRLETEADGVRQRRGVVTSEPWGRRRVGHPWAWFVASAVLVLVGVVAGTGAVLTLQEQHALSQRTDEIRNEISE
ncbi:hypothetical protein [Microbacterium ulmi]|uniref:Uncharacterized protein n=1 Tax=Microbacterium ulmi TaxID=179095 RepID=A0A7Y2Q0N5_9MICO|nr:hypothetical protein [Microbacterium ulmi]NII68401.1 hypothetical protein [Microbacterium ulmi]NNH03070.1 hypothetical protein [Microbacterium ulmi]